MEEIPKTWNKELARLDRPRKEKKARRWTLLLVDDQGKIVSVRGIKMFLWLFSAVFFVSVIFSTYAYFRHQKMQDSLRQLQSTVASLRQRNATDRNKKNELMVRLAAAEARLESMGKEIPNGQMAAVSVESIEPRTAGETATGESEMPQTVSSKTETESGVSDQPARLTPPETPMEEPDKPHPDPKENPELADVEDFLIRQIPGRNEVKVQFKVRNLTNGSAPVSGYAFVVLKPDGAIPAEWISLPDSDLVEGKPIRLKKGRPFTILRFKTVRFSSVTGRDPKIYKTATTLVFGNNGELLVERDFPVRFETESNVDG